VLFAIYGVRARLTGNAATENSEVSKHRQLNPQPSHDFRES
jgi:hypothetical protein